METGLKLLFAAAVLGMLTVSGVVGYNAMAPVVDNGTALFISTAGIVMGTSIAMRLGAFLGVLGGGAGGLIASGKQSAVLGMAALGYVAGVTGGAYLGHNFTKDLMMHAFDNKSDSETIQDQKHSGLTEDGSSVLKNSHTGQKYELKLAA